MAVTRINNNQITDASAGNAYVGINASTKIQPYSITATKLANNLTYGSDLTVTGNLTVQGNTTAIDTTYTTIEDPVILLASTQTGAPSVDIGFIGERGTSDNIAFVWDESADEFVTAFTSSTETNTTITISSYASLKTLDTTVTGNLSTAGFATVTGNITGGNVNSNAQVVATGNITGGNLVTGGLASVTGNITGGNIGTAGQVSATGNVTGGNLVTGAQVVATGNITGGNLNTAGQVVATGNITGGNIVTAGLGSFGTTVTATGNITGGNLNTAGQVVATGNVTGGNLSAGSGIITTTGNINGGNLNVTTGVRAATGYFTGNVDVLGNLNASIGIVYANSGIFYGNAVTGNGAIYGGIPGYTPLGSNVVIQFAGNANSYSQVNFQNISNLTAASTDFIATADNGTDTSYYLDLGINSSTFNDQVNYPGFGPNDSYVHNHGGNLILNPESAGKTIKLMVGGTGNSDVIANVSTSGISVTGVVSASGNVSGGNLTTAGQAVATGNITGGNLITAGLVSATGNIVSSANVNGANLNASANLVSLGAVVTGNVTGGNLLTAGLVSATGNVVSSANINGANINASANLVSVGAVVTGNVTGGNLLTSGQVSATGNVTGGNLVTGGRVVATGNIVSSANIAGGNLAVTGTINTATLETTGNVLIGGNLTVQGNIQYVNVDDLRVEDPIIIMGTGPNGAPLTTDDGMDRGIYMEWYKTGLGNSWIGWENSSGNLIAAADVVFSANNVVNVNNYGTFQAGNIYAQSAVTTGNITGGNLITAGLVSATGNIVSSANVNGANVNATANVVTVGIVASGNITGGNLLTAGLVSATGNIVSSANVNGANLNASANLVAVGAVVSGNITGGNLLTAGLVSATGNVTGGNLVTGAQVVATGNITGGNLITAGLASITGNVSGGNLNTSGLVSATGNITGGNLVTPNLVSSATVVATGNITGGNLITAGLVSATGNVSGGNLNTGGTINATGNVNGTGAVFSGNVTAQNFIGNISGNIDAGGSNTQVQFNDNDLLNGTAGFTFDKTSNAVSVTGNITGGNLNTGAQVVATGNVTGGNIITSGQAVVTGNITGGNLNTGAQVVATGNITGGNLNTAGQVVATGNITGGNLNTAGQAVVTGNITGGNLTTAGTGTFGNITISGSNVNSTAGRITVNSADADVDFAIDGDTTANVFYVDAGTGTVSFGSSTQTTNAIVAMNATNSFLMPVGNTAQRPDTGVTGMLRFNSTTNGVEVYNATEWATVGTPSFTIISDQQFNGNGVAVSYTLANATTTNSTIVSINGIVQIPTIAYSVGGAGSNVLTFTEAPETGDIIDVRALTTTTEVVAISNSPGNAVVATNPTVGIVEVTGDFNPTANVTYNLGTASLRWKDLFLSGSSMTLGNIVMKNTSGNTVAFYGPDGTTPATIDSTNVDTTTITNGTSNVSVASSGGNIRFNVAGTSNVMVVQQSTVAITGDLSVSGNATLSGNILGDRVQNGTTSFDIQTASGNANITVGGTSNVAVFSTAGANISGTLGVTGNITGGNLISSGILSVAGNIVSTGSNGVANIGSATTYFNTVHAKATSAQYADLAENYAADAEYAPGTVLSFGGDNEVTVSTTEGDRRIAGVVSTNPSYIMNSVLEAEHVATIALTGRVPTFVSGPIEKGDMMVSAGNGRAVACATPAIGTVIGKALENHAGGDGVIEVVVGRL